MRPSRSRGMGRLIGWPRTGSELLSVEEFTAQRCMADLPLGMYRYRAGIDTGTSGSARGAYESAGHDDGEYPLEAGDVIEWICRDGDDVGILAGLDGAFSIPEAADIGGH